MSISGVYAYRLYLNISHNQDFFFLFADSKLSMAITFHTIIKDQWWIIWGSGGSYRLRRLRDHTCMKLSRAAVKQKTKKKKNNSWYFFVNALLLRPLWVWVHKGRRRRNKRNKAHACRSRLLHLISQGFMYVDSFLWHVMISKVSCL